jgi:hypothetical protein
MIYNGKEKRQKLIDILDTDFTDYTVVFIYCNSVIRVIPCLNIFITGADMNQWIRVVRVPI